MVLCEERECSVCYRPYARTGRVPRVLHCRHTFCAVCLEAMAVAKSGLLTVRCPLCRQMTCVGGGSKLHEALWVNSRVWDQIPDFAVEEEDEEEEEEDEERGGQREEVVLEAEEDAEDGIREEEEEEEEERAEGASAPAQCPVSKHYRPRIRLPSFLRKLSFARQPQERIMPGSNVEMKSWRRLATADMI
ncbi:probable E3 ubiquitin-protein ligase rnf113 [Sardina pilchardus]|uniref:probable E3 ubiquitin-protein ligase rnf113 n=1 Tax=Sardina pilchardus TaxID=27697 RepID=UPI002E0FDA23